MLFKCSPTWQRVLVAVLRPVCDMVSVAIYLLKGEFALAKATLLAYRDFILLHKTLSAKRKEIRASAIGEADMIYRGSIVLRYILRHRFGKMM